VPDVAPLHGEAEPAERLASPSAPFAETLALTVVERHGAAGGMGAMLSAAPPGMRAGAARALQRACGNRRFGRMLARQTPGEAAVATGRDWLKQDADVKAEVDVLKVAIQEIKAGTSVGFNRDAGKTRLTTALVRLGKPSGDVAAVEAEWNWLVDNRTQAGTTAYRTKESAFFAHFETPLAATSAKHKRAMTAYWLKHTPPQVMNDIVDASDWAIPPDELYAYAAIEGLIDYVRAVLGITDKKVHPTEAQLTTVSTAIPFSGFGFLGADDFWLDLHATRHPMSGHLPPGFPLASVLHQAAQQEPKDGKPGRIVDSAVFPNLKVGLQALVASLRRRRTIFIEDAIKYGYAIGSRDEIVYWTYVYFNFGENNGQLEKYQGKRVLSDWIKAGEYPNAIEVLESWRMINEMALF
jgi:hypothetical protein